MPNGRHERGPGVTVLVCPAQLGTAEKTDSLSVASGNWEQLSIVTDALNRNGVLECYVDCDGTAGDIFIDDWAVSIA